MRLDELGADWRVEAGRVRLAVDAGRLAEEVRRDSRRLAAAVFWRDAGEIGVGLALVPTWVVLGVRMALPWTWYLMIPALLGVVGRFLVHRHRSEPPPGPGEPLRAQVAGALAAVERQVRFLRGVPRWYLGPLALAMLPFLGHVAWRERDGGWVTAIVVGLVLGIDAAAFASVAWLNRRAVRTDLEPRRRELAALLAGLDDATPAAGGGPG